MHKLISLALLLTGLTHGAAAQIADDAPAGTVADIILVNGKVIAVDEDFSIEQGIAVSGDRIANIGDNEVIRAMAGPETRVIDLGGKAVIPGLIDNHHHFARAAEQWFRQVRWTGVPTREEALRMLQEKAAELGAGEWVVVLGGWMREQFTDDQAPFTREELDSVLPDNPVYIQEGYQTGYANSLALQETGVTADTTVQGGQIVIGPDGRPSGRLQGSAAFLRVAERIPRPSAQQWNDSLQQLVEDYTRAGLTTVLDVGGNTVTPEHYQVLTRAGDEGTLDMRVFYTLNQQNQVGGSAGEVIRALQNLTPRSGDDRFGRISYGEMTYAAMRDSTGALWVPESEEFDNYERILRAAAAGRWQIHEHANRDDKILRLLRMMETIDMTTPIRPLRWTFAHAETASDEAIQKAENLGVHFAIHSSAAYGAVTRAQQGDDVSRFPPIRMISDLGATWGLGSDGTVVAGYNPFRNIAWAVTGVAANGEKLLEATVGVEDALTAHTLHNAYLLFMEDEIGSLELGKYADLLVLDRDILTVPENEIQDIRPVLTMVGGEIVYEAQ